MSQKALDIIKKIEAKKADNNTSYIEDSEPKSAESIYKRIKAPKPVSKPVEPPVYDFTPDTSSTPETSKNVIETIKAVPGAVGSQVKQIPEALKYIFDMIPEAPGKAWRFMKGAVQEPGATGKGLAKGAIESLPGVTRDDMFKTIDTQKGQTTGTSIKYTDTKIPDVEYPSLTEEQARKMTPEKLRDYRLQAERSKALGRFLGLAGQAALSGGASGSLAKSGVEKALWWSPRWLQAAIPATVASLGAEVPYSIESLESDRPGEEVAADFILGVLTDLGTGSIISKSKGLRKAARSILTPKKAKIVNKLFEVGDINKPTQIKGIRFEPAVKPPAGGIVTEGAKLANAFTGKPIKFVLDAILFDNIAKLDPRDMSVLTDVLTKAEINKGAITFPEYYTAAKYAVSNPKNPTPLDLAGVRVAETLKDINNRLSDVGDEIITYLENPKNKLVYNARATIDDLYKIGIAKKTGGIIDEGMNGYQIKSAKNRLFNAPGEENLILDVKELIDQIPENATPRELHDFRRALDSKIDNFHRQSMYQSPTTATELSLHEVRNAVNGLIENSTADPGISLVNEHYSDLKNMQNFLSRRIGESIDKELGSSRQGANLMKSAAVANSGGGTKSMFNKIKQETGIDLLKDANYAELAMRLAGDSRGASLLSQLSNISGLKGPIGFAQTASNVGKGIFKPSDEYLRKFYLRSQQDLAKGMPFVVPEGMNPKEASSKLANLRERAMGPYLDTNPKSYSGDTFYRRKKEPFELESNPRSSAIQRRIEPPEAGLQTGGELVPIKPNPPETPGGKGLESNPLERLDDISEDIQPTSKEKIETPKQSKSSKSSTQSKDKREKAMEKKLEELDKIEENIQPTSKEKIETPKQSKSSKSSTTSKDKREKAMEKKLEELDKIEEEDPGPDILDMIVEKDIPPISKEKIETPKTSKSSKSSTYSKEKREKAMEKKLEELDKIEEEYGDVDMKVEENIPSTSKEKFEMPDIYEDIPKEIQRKLNEEYPKVIQDKIKEEWIWLDKPDIPESKKNKNISERIKEKYTEIIENIDSDKGNVNPDLGFDIAQEYYHSDLTLNDYFLLDLMLKEKLDKQTGIRRYPKINEDLSKIDPDYLEIDEEYPNTNKEIQRELDEKIQRNINGEIQRKLNEGYSKGRQRRIKREWSWLDDPDILESKKNKNISERIKEKYTEIIENADPADIGVLEKLRFDIAQEYLHSDLTMNDYFLLDLMVNDKID